MKANKIMKGQAVPNHRRINCKEVDSNIDLVQLNTIKPLNNKNN
jgi:hypothetical protein